MAYQGSLLPIDSIHKRRIEGLAHGEVTGVVGVGSSDRSAEAFCALLRALPSDTGLAVVYLQAGGASPEVFRRFTSMKVMQAADGSRIAPNCVYVNPPRDSITIESGVLHLHPGRRGERLIDRFLLSLAGDRGPQGIAVLLSDPTNDGIVGTEAIAAGGGVTFVQDSTVAHGGMCQSALGSGNIDFVLSPERIAGELVSVATDFAPVESRAVQAPGRAMLVDEGRFFQPPEAFDALQETALSALFAGRTRQDAIRVWVLDCGSGEEVYSLAIALKEHAKRIGSQTPLVIYATGDNDAAIERSRSGLYSPMIARSLTPDRLRRFFVKVDCGYRVCRDIREPCVFARHKVFSDAPLARMDLVSCRNLLPLLNRLSQRKLLRIVHRSLEPDGVLFLGAPQSLPGSSGPYETLDSEHGLFRKSSGRRPVKVAIPTAQPGADRPRIAAADTHDGELRRELAETREYLQSIIEQQKATNEDLQSSNQELQAANEELQSVNAELETSLQETLTSNDRLLTLNLELRRRSEELTGLNRNLGGVFQCFNTALVLVGRDLRIRFFTAGAEKLFSLVDRDIGRPIGHFRSNLQFGDLPQMLARVIDSATALTLDLRDPRGHGYRLLLHPSFNVKNQIEGVVIAIQDTGAARVGPESTPRPT